ncbi:Sir2 family NAD-dependent protein deacetylase [bacterium]|nr:Sir2 family NAD-dependent protein deacetylase [bacterium]
MDDATSALVGRAAELIRSAEHVVALTGAGISTESGIPDFRGPEGVWTKNPEAERAATLQHYLADRELRVRSWKSRASSPYMSAEPNAGHVALTELHRKGKLELLVTQNVDGLHERAGFPRRDLVEIHGNVREYVCMRCGHRGPMSKVLARVAAGEDDPPCPICGGILKSATISFGQSLVPEDLERAQFAAANCDLLITAGTTLGVYPIAEMAPIALRAGAKLIILNAQETPFDEYAEVVIRGQLGEVLPAIVALV